MYLIIGLGNPGRKFEMTRHNLAWQVIDDLPFCSSLMWREKFKGEFFKITEHGEDFIFLKPQTFMNLSGESVRAAVDFFKIDVENVLVLHDELDFAFGTLGFKSGGGLAGHNGLKSMASHLGTQNFKRLRLGIGRPQYGDVSNHVLSNFNEEESPLLEDFNKLAALAVEEFMKKGFQKAANKFSKKSIIN